MVNQHSLQNGVHYITEIQIIVCMNVNDIKMYNSWQCYNAKLVKVPVLVTDSLTGSNHSHTSPDA